MEKVFKVRILNQEADETLDDFNDRLTRFLTRFASRKILDIQHTPIVLNGQILATVIVKYHLHFDTEKEK